MPELAREVRSFLFSVSFSIHESCQKAAKAAAQDQAEGAGAGAGARARARAGAIETAVILERMAKNCQAA